MPQPTKGGTGVQVAVLQQQPWAQSRQPGRPPPCPPGRKEQLYSHFPGRDLVPRGLIRSVVYTRVQCFKIRGSNIKIGRF